MNLGCGPIPGEGVPWSPRLPRERALHAAGSEIAAAVTRSRPAIFSPETAKPMRTDDEQISQTGRQTERPVLMRNYRKCLICLVGAPGLEPGTR
jgi:hypothetical protein